MDQEIHIPGFELLDKIGEGACGTVYRAHQLSLDRLVAIKILWPKLAADPEYAASFLQEARAAAKLSHPNIVQAIEVGESNGVCFFVMELVEGGNLLEHLQRNGRMSEEAALDIASQVAEALDFAWTQAGMIHRDIKPANILLTPNGRAKLADLGLAMKRGAQKESSGYIEGTPQYCSPEQCRGEPNLDSRTDLYALGATLYHMVCGGPPFDGDDPAKVMTMQITHPVEPPRFLNPDISQGFEAMILKLLAKDPADRFQSPAELIEAIKQVRAPLPAPSVEPQPVGEAAVSAPVVTLAPRRRLWAWLGGAALVAVGVMVVSLAVLSASRPGGGRDQSGTPPKSESLVQQITGSVMNRLGIHPPANETASGASPSAQATVAGGVPAPAAPPATPAGASSERPLQRILSVFRKILPTPSPAASRLMLTLQDNVFTRTANGLVLVWRRPIEQAYRAWKNPAVAPKPPVVASAVLPAQQLPPPSPAPAPPPVVQPAPAPPPAAAASVAALTPSVAAPTQPPATPVPSAPPPPPVAEPAPVAPMAAAPAATSPAPLAPPQPTPPAAQPPAPPTPPSPPVEQPVATNVVVAALKPVGLTSTSAVKRLLIRPSAAPKPPPLPEAALQNAPMNLEVQRIFRRKDAADASIRGMDARSNYLESMSLRVIVQNLSPQSFTNVIVRWAIVKRAVGRNPMAKDVFWGAEEKLTFKPIERKIIETPPVEAGGVMSSMMGRAYGEMIKGHGVQVLIGTNCVAEDVVPASLKISYKNLQPVPRPAP